MIDATKLRRSGGARASSSLEGADGKEPAEGAAKTDNPGAKVERVAAYPAKSMVLNGGRYYTFDTKK